MMRSESTPGVDPGPGGDRDAHDIPGTSVFTIGHSNGSIESLIGLLIGHDVVVLVDVRSQPYSRYAPHFSRDALQRAVREAGLEYVFMGDSLGGRPDARECYDALGRVSYDRAQELDSYKRGIDELLELIPRGRVCLLCGEEDPVRCHRRLLIGRSLLRRGVDVRHIHGDGSIESETSVQARFEGDETGGKQLRLW